MGFGTSGSALVVFAALFIAMSTFYTAASNSAERVREADAARDRHQQAIRQTSVDVVSATWNSTSTTLTLAVDNTGERTLSVDHLDAVVVAGEGNYLDSTDFERAEVAGQSTDVWRPGERLVLEDEDSLSMTGPPERVTLVSGPGVADTASVEVTA